MAIDRPLNMKATRPTPYLAGKQVTTAYLSPCSTKAMRAIRSTGMSDLMRPVDPSGAKGLIATILASLVDRLYKRAAT